MAAPSPEADPALRRLSWTTLAFTVAVVLGGAVVRATDSGAGCGESWPRCEGHIIPFSATGSTAVELTHRTMTFVLGLALVALVVMVYRLRPRHHPLRRSLNWSIGFFFGEVLIGAGLVLFGWVEDDASVARAIAVTVHLVNTFLLLAALTLTAHLASGRPVPDLRSDRRLGRTMATGAIAMLVIGASGALNALADTLGEGAAPWPLYELRVLHPVIAVAGAILVLVLTRSPRLAELDGTAGRLRAGIQTVIAVQLVAGVVNVALLTPVETQVLHLLLADLLWVLWIRLGAETAPAPSPRAVMPTPAVPA